MAKVEHRAPQPVAMKMGAILLAAALMVGGLGVAQWLTPHKMWADTLPALDLPAVIPAEFGPWRLDPNVTPVLADPTVEATMHSVYSQSLSRTYVRADGARVMLSIAYGKNQNSASTAAHRPEFCYTAQGFVVRRTRVESIGVDGRELNAVQLMATVGPRFEPITYWVTLGDRASIPGFARKLDQIKYGLQGWIMDGMLMRVSSLIPSAEQSEQNAAYLLHTAFLNDMAKAIPESQRARFFGSNSH